MDVSTCVRIFLGHITVNVGMGIHCLRMDLNAKVKIYNIDLSIYISCMHCTYTAQPCPTLSEPVNGLMQCSGPQVTDEYCTFICHQGYELEGSSNRSCLPNNTWSGTNIDSACPPLLCGELQHSDSTVIAHPCFDEFNSTCTVICEEGFQVNNSSSTFFTQTCSLTNETNAVKWTHPETCSGTVAHCYKIFSLHGRLWKMVFLNKNFIVLLFNW